MEEFVYVDGKKYKKGYTTGSCATAATKASLLSLLTGKKFSKIKILTPRNIELEIPIDSQTIERDFIISTVVKDGGDDIDATHMMEISSKIEIIKAEDIPESISKTRLQYIAITSGEGIGVVTKKGLSVEVGRPAINPVPIEMIEREIESIIDEFNIDVDNFLNGRVFLITVFAPEGKVVAKKTFNENLGIVGGISIIGTTGIVEPMSDEGWKKALSTELNIKKEAGYDEIILVPGNIGLDTMVDTLGFDREKIVKMSNFIGYMLMECKRLGFNKIIIGGHIGKLIKLSAGIIDTHSRIADARNEVMVSNLALMGANIEFLKKIDSCVTTDAMIPIIKEYGYEDVFDIIAKKCVARAKKHIRDDENSFEVSVYLFSMDGELLAKR